MNCGTQAGYQRHRYHGTPKCDPCLEANARRSAQYRGGYVDGPRGRNTMGITDCIIDVLSSHNRWMTTGTLLAIIDDMHPDWKEASVRRTLYRLVDTGRVERRHLPWGVEFYCDEWASW